jgi:hypothetical protein
MSLHLVTETGGICIQQCNIKQVKILPCDLGIYC